MNILLIEDTESKKNAISLVMKEASPTAKITTSSNLADAMQKMTAKKFDLIIFDMYLPLSQGDTEQDYSSQLIEAFSKGKNSNTEAITLTQYPIDVIDNIQEFNLFGITVVHYDTSEHWKQALCQKIYRASQKPKFDFLIFCALPKERQAYNQTTINILNVKNIANMDCQEVLLDGYRGLIIRPKAMGLVNMAIAVSRAIERFEPKIIAMSGICAGVTKESSYLDIIVGEICWEYQTGKFKQGKFIQEPYQVVIESQLQTDLQQSAEDQSILESIKMGLYHKELKDSKIIIAPLSSGSAVIADDKKMKEICGQHRKMAGLEMEMYAMYEAARQSPIKPLFFGAKAVVDMGGESKADDFHEAACILSARYVVKILEKQLKQLNSEIEV